MAEITRLFFWRHLRGEPSAHQILHRRGKVAASGRGLTLWFNPLSASVAELPLDDRELPFLLTCRSRDYQDVNVQGVITFRVAEPEVLATRVDFSLDLDSGALLRQPLEKLAGMLTELAQELALGYVAAAEVRQVLVEGPELLRPRLAEGLARDPGLREMGLVVVAVRVSAVRPSAELERALQTPTREALQQSADEATFQRRALAVEKERAIQENELQNQIELARREETLIAQRGQNEKRRTLDEVEAQRIQAESRAAAQRIGAEAEAQSIRLVEQARVAAEAERMDIYRALPPPVMLGLAAQELAGKLQRIEHLNLSPDLLSSLLTRLASAGAERLEAE